jgi:hypothetical protein
MSTPKQVSNPGQAIVSGRAVNQAGRIHSAVAGDATVAVAAPLWMAEKPAAADAIADIAGAHAAPDRLVAAGATVAAAAPRRMADRIAVADGAHGRDAAIVAAAAPLRMAEKAAAAGAIVDMAGAFRADDRSVVADAGVEFAAGPVRIAAASTRD